MIRTSYSRSGMASTSIERIPILADAGGRTAPLGRLHNVLTRVEGRGADVVLALAQKPRYRIGWRIVGPWLTQWGKEGIRVVRRKRPERIGEALAGALFECIETFAIELLHR